MNAPQRTRWQRFFGSPFYPLTLWFFSVYVANTTHGWEKATWVVLSVLLFLTFITKGNQRWGKP